jgi:hypothetical protein
MPLFLKAFHRRFLAHLMSVRMTFIITSHLIDTTLSQAHKSCHFAIISKIKSTIISSKIHALRYVYLEYCLSPILS